MKLIEFRSYFRSQLKEVSSVEQSDDFLKRITQNYFGWDAVKFGLEPDYQLSDFELSKLSIALRDLEREKPLQYILGTSHFMNLDFEVNSFVLIPRPETEELVEWILKNENDASPKTILDIGTGSGCIAIALKQGAPKWKISAVDVSEKALLVAKKNAKNNELDVEFYLEDILDEPSWPIGLDIIVSNPPYVLPSEKGKMKNNVLAYEPDLALFVPENDPLLFYKRIIEFGQKNLNQGGALYFEINPIFVKELSSFLKNHNFESVEVRKDFLKKPRMIKAVKSTT